MISFEYYSYQIIAMGTNLMAVRLGMEGREEGGSVYKGVAWGRALCWQNISLS